MASRRFPGFGDERTRRTEANSRTEVRRDGAPAAAAAATAAARETRLARLVALESYLDHLVRLRARGALARAVVLGPRRDARGGVPARISYRQAHHRRRL